MKRGEEKSRQRRDDEDEEGDWGDLWKVVRPTKNDDPAKDQSGRSERCVEE
jgi:hypothetical protein